MTDPTFSPARWESMTFSTAPSSNDMFLKWMIIATNMSNAMRDELGQHDASSILRLVEERLKTKGAKL